MNLPGTVIGFHAIGKPCRSVKLTDVFIKPLLRTSIVIMFFLAVLTGSLVAQDLSSFKKLGTIQTKSAGEIHTSRFSIGGETLDRDYADYNAYKSFLGPLGAKRIRLQGGWARCEKTRGQYDFQWLDVIVNDALAQGVQPWLQTSYGNPIYPGGGDAALAGGIPTSDEALLAWDAWVAALVEHFKDRVHEWEVWNEPDLSKKFSATAFAQFHERTASIIRKQQSSARIIGLALCCKSWSEYADTVLTYLENKKRTDLIDVVTIHGYSLRPENTYDRIDNLRKVFQKHKLVVAYWQGENGAPSTEKSITVGAMKEIDWSETTQAKWNLRRLTGDMGHDLEVTNLFQISDMNYAKGDHMTGLNSKGLLKTRTDNSVERPKLSYKSYQYLISLFSENLQRIKNARLTLSDDKVLGFAYTKDKVSGSAITIWSAEATPSASYPSRTISIAADQVKFKNPVLVDLLDGKVYSLPKGNYSVSKGKYEFTGIPVSDYPRVIVEKEWITLDETNL